MAQYMIQYAANPGLVMAVTNQQSGATLSIQKYGGDSNLFVWNYNPLNKLITLVASGTQQLCITVPGNNCNGTPILQIQPAAIPASQYQQWNVIGGTTFINSVGCPGKCIDLDNRNINPGTPIWLYPNNGSPAQQWILSPISTFDLEGLPASIE
jgi:hypothetical protein